MPALFGKLMFFLGVDEYFHAIVEEGVGLGEVEDLKRDWERLRSITYSEVEPLGVAPCVDVGLQDQLVVLVIQLRHQSQVAGFES